MRNPAAIERIERTEALLAELKAIAVWNRSYWRCRHHEWWETVALVSRLRRRIEILSEVVALVAARHPRVKRALNISRPPPRCLRRISGPRRTTRRKDKPHKMP